jgi:hypothetical protein
VPRPTLGLLRTTLALLLVVLVAGCSSGETATPPTTVPPIRAADGRLGIATTTTDRAALAGIDLAVADVNRRGGVLGHPVRVVDRQRADAVVTTQGLVLGKAQPQLALVDPDPTFLDRLRQVDPTVTDGLEARTTYAAVLLATDLARKAGSDEPKALARAMG